MPIAKPFYMVVKDNDNRLVRHESEKKAIAEAKRLAEKEGCRFYVLSVTNAYEPVERVQEVHVWKKPTIPEHRPSDFFGFPITIL